VRFGKPVLWAANLQDGEDESEIARAYIDAVMGELAAMLPPELRGDYADTAEQQPLQEQVTAMP
jgi:hypothetical protein